MLRSLLACHTDDTHLPFHLFASFMAIKSPFSWYDLSMAEHNRLLLEIIASMDSSDRSLVSG
jgi:hypothetical protein